MYRVLLALLVSKLNFQRALQTEPGDAVTHEQSLITKILTIHFQANIDFSLCCKFQRLVFSERREILPTDRYIHTQHDYATVCPVAPPTEA